MARPKPDSQKITAQLLDAAQTMLVQSNGRRLILSELAARIGISQSYAHRFFPTKADLVRALAAQWFEAVEADSRRIVALDCPAAERLELWLLTLLQIKRARYDANPALFRAYLELAADHEDLVALHSKRLLDALGSLLSEMVSFARLEEVTSIVEAATVMFRDPYLIARYREQVTDQRAVQVLRALSSALW